MSQNILFPTVAELKMSAGRDDLGYSLRTVADGEVLKAPGKVIIDSLVLISNPLNSCRYMAVILCNGAERIILTDCSFIRSSFCS